MSNRRDCYDNTAIERWSYGIKMVAKQALLFLGVISTP